MANVGRLNIELGINAAAFSEGLQKATYATQKFGQNAAKEFRAFGNSLAVVAGSFGAFGAKGAALASAVSLAGQAAGAATERFAKLGKSVGVVTGIAAGATAAFASLAAAGIGMVVKTSAEILHEMERQAQSAGVNITEFSRLAYTTKVLGLEQETLVKGLQRMNRAALMAAEGSKQQQFAFRMLLGTGNAFQDVIHGGTVNLEALADGFNRIHDPQLQSALAMQVFGRAGAELVPLLNQGSAGLQKFAKEADALGVTLTAKDAEAATALTMNLTRLREAFSGIAIRITNELSPALSKITDSMVDFAKNGQRVSAMGTALGRVLIDVTKAVFYAADAWTFWGAKFDELSAHWSGFVENFKAGVEYMSSGTVSAATKKAMNDAIAAELSSTKEAEAKITKSYEDLAVELADLNTNFVIPPPKIHGKTGKPSGLAIPSTTPATAESDTAKKFIATLEAQAAAAKRLGDAISQSVGAQAMLNAQEEAAKNIADQRASIEERINTLTTELKENANSYSAQDRANREKQIAQLQSFEKELDTNRDKITQLYATIAASHEAQNATKSLESETVKYTEKIKALKADLAALASGHPFKTQSADLADDIEKVNQLQDALNEAQKLYGKNSDAVKELAAALAVANKELAQHRDQLEQIDALQQQENDLKKQQEEAQQAVNERIRQEQEFVKKNISTLTEGIAKAIVTGKENFRELGAAIEESLLKTGITNMLTNLGQGFKSMNAGGKFSAGLAPHGKGPFGMVSGLLGFGLGKTSERGTQSNPMITKDVASLGGALGGGKSGGAGGLLGGLGGMLGGAGKGAGGIFKGLFGSLMHFIPFLAHGGDVTPGRAYVVGEKHPEFFVPRAPGTVVPRINFESGRSSQNNVTIQTQMQMVDTGGGEEFLARHAAAVTDAVTRGLRQRGVI